MRGFLIGLGLIGGCAHPLEGHVVDDAGAPVAGARVSGGDCAAVSGPDGAFTTPCEVLPTTVVVTHPAYLDASAPVGDDPVSARLVALPTAPGVYLQGAGAFVAPADAPLTRTGDDTAGWTYCVRAGGPAAPSVTGPVRMLDVHDVDWRVFPVGADGCVYRLQRTGGGWWTSPSTAIPVTRESELAAGRSWLTADLPVGDYALVEWYAGAPVPDGDIFRARRFRVAAGS